MRYFVSVFCVLLFFQIVFQSRLYATTVVEVLAVEYPPFTSSKVESNGVSFRLLKQRLETVDQFQIKPLFLPPARLQQKIKKGDWCLSFYPVPATDKTRFLALAEQQFKIGLYHKLDDPLINWTQLEELKGYRVALLRSDRSSQLYQRFVRSGLKPMFVDEISQGLRMLQMGRVEVALGDEHLKSYVWVELNNLEGIGFADTALFQSQIGIFVNQDCPIAQLM